MPSFFRAITRSGIRLIGILYTAFISALEQSRLYPFRSSVHGMQTQTLLNLVVVRRCAFLFPHSRHRFLSFNKQMLTSLLGLFFFQENDAIAICFQRNGCEVIESPIVLLQRLIRNASPVVMQLPSRSTCKTSQNSDIVCVYLLILLL